MKIFSYSHEKTSFLQKFKDISKIVNMTDRMKYISITIILFLAFIFALSANYYRIGAAVDYIKGLFTPQNDIVEIGGGSDLQQTPVFDERKLKLRKNPSDVKKTFADLPAGFAHCGPFLIFTAAQETSLDDVTKKIITYTTNYRRSQLKRSILLYNGIKGSTVKAGQSIFIPDALPCLSHDLRNKELPALISARGLYITGTTAGSPKFLERIQHLKKTGINAVVFDVKDVDGMLTYRSRAPLAVKYDLHERASIDNIDLFIKNLKDQGIYVIARISAFRDIQLVKKAPDLAIKSKRAGGTWKGGGEVWCDPTNMTVQNYVIDLSLEMASKGVDEIQFDYIRFPTDGSQADTSFSFESGQVSREQTISNFLKRAHEKISTANTRLSIDIFGVVAWGKEVDINSTGQRIELLSPYCDYISPMLYPSHFNNGFDGYNNPADHPYYFINEGNKKVMSLIGENKTKIRPWLQAFRWKVTSYGSQYIVKQVQASDDSNAMGYLFWNASNDYKYVLSAMESLTKEGKIK